MSCHNCLQRLSKLGYLLFITKSQRPTRIVSTSAQPALRMCQILIQVYACGHQKPICITPCFHACGNQPHSHSSRPGTPFSPDSPHSGSLLSRASTPRSHFHLRPLSPPDPPRWLILLPSYDPATQYCPTYSPHNTARSRYPCLQCYLLPEWAAYRNRFADKYCSDHPGTSFEDVGVLSGITLIPQRLGLVNVVAAMDRISSLRGGNGMSRKATGRDDEDSQSEAKKP